MYEVDKEIAREKALIARQNAEVGVDGDTALPVCRRPMACGEYEVPPAKRNSPPAYLCQPPPRGATRSEIAKGLGGKRPTPSPGQIDRTMAVTAALGQPAAVKPSGGEVKRGQVGTGQSEISSAVTLESMRVYSRMMEHRNESSVEINLENSTAGVRLTQADIEAAFDRLFKVSCTDINDRNLLVPIDTGVWEKSRLLLSRRMGLASRAMLGVYYEICRTGSLNGSIPIQLFATWCWGSELKPRNWRTQLKNSLQQVEDAMANQGAKTVVLGLKENQIKYAIAPVFLGCLAHMTTGGRLKIRRSATIPRRPTSAEISQLREDARYPKSEFPDVTMREIVTDMGARYASERTLSGLHGVIDMVFIPGMLGDKSVCQKYGETARVLAANHTREYKVENGLVPAFGGTSKIKCPHLDPKVVYSAFAANDKRRANNPSSRKGRGYLLDRWLEFYALRSEQKLFSRWSAAAKLLDLVVIGIDSQNNFFDLDGMRAMQIGKLRKLHIRVYTPSGWQQSWTKAFGMPLPEQSVGGQKVANQDSAAAGDLLVIRARVREKTLRKTARDLKLDPGNLSRYLNGRGSLAPAKAAALRQYLFNSQLLGGPRIKKEFHEIIKQNPGNLGWALAYRRLLGWAVIPLNRITRKGEIRWKKYQALLPSEDEIREWWTKWPNASIGLVLGRLSGVFAIDVDNAAAEKALFALTGGPPVCATQRSGSYTAATSFKKHYLFRHPVDLSTGAKWEPVVPGLEFRGERGLLVLAPSVHKSGTGQYHWEMGSEIWTRALAPMPKRVLQILRDRDRAVSSGDAGPVQEAARVATDRNLPDYHFKGRKFSARTRELLAGLIKPGNRNERLFAAAREMRDFGMAVQAAIDRLLAAAQGIGLEQADTIATIRSAYSRSPR